MAEENIDEVLAELERIFGEGNAHASNVNGYYCLNKNVLALLDCTPEEVRDQLFLHIKALETPGGILIDEDSSDAVVSLNGSILRDHLDTLKQLTERDVTVNALLSDRPNDSMDGTKEHVIMEKTDFHKRPDIAALEALTGQKWQFIGSENLLRMEKPTHGYQRCNRLLNYAMSCIGKDGTTNPLNRKNTTCVGRKGDLFKLQVDVEDLDSAKIANFDRKTSNIDVFLDRENKYASSGFTLFM